MALFRAVSLKEVQLKLSYNIMVIVWIEGVVVILTSCTESSQWGAGHGQTPGQTIVSGMIARNNIPLCYIMYGVTGISLSLIKNCPCVQHVPSSGMLLMCA